MIKKEHMRRSSMTITSVLSILLSSCGFLLSCSVEEKDYSRVDEQDLISAEPTPNTSNSPKNPPPSTEKSGQDFFTQTVAPLTQTKCISCHPNTYIFFKPFLTQAGSTSSTTATENRLIDKATGTMIHGGGNVCGNKNSSPCTEFQEWWNLENQ